MATEQRVSRLEGAYEQVDRRLDSMEQAISGLHAEINSRFNALYVLIGASWVALIVAMIGLYFR